MNKNKVIPLPESFLFINILIWIGINYLIYCIFDSIIILIISAILCLISIIILLKNKRYLCEYDNSHSVLMSITGYWFWLFSIFTIYLQIKSNTSIWFYIIELIALILIFINAKKKNAINERKNNQTLDIEKAQKTQKTTVIISTCIMVLFSIIHISLTESQTLFIISICLLFFTFISFWFFSSLLIVYFYDNKQ